VVGCAVPLRGEEADEALIMALGGPSGRIVIFDGPRQAPPEADCRRKADCRRTLTAAGR
jgi:hypothetical protein